MLVYLMTDPRNPLKGYVGQTRLTASRRLGDHLKAAQYGSALPVHRWIRKLQREGVAPRVEVLRVLETPEECNRVERELIAKYRSRPEMKLYNVTDGGETAPFGESFRAACRAAAGTPEARARKSKETKAGWDDPEVRARRVAGLKRAQYTPAARAARSKLSQAMWDRTSPEDRAKRLAKAHTLASRKARSEKKTLRNADPAVRKYLSEKSAAYYRTPEGRALQQARSIASNARPDVKAKLALSTAKAWADPVHKENRKAAMRAALSTPEAKTRKSELMRERWANPEYKARVGGKGAAKQRGVRRTPVIHGTYAEYKKGCRCNECRAANTAKARVYIARALEGEV